MSVTRAIATLERKRHAAQLLESARRQAGLTQVDIAAIADVSKTRVQAWIDDEDRKAEGPLHLMLDPTLGPVLLRLIAAEHGLDVSRTPTDLDSSASDVLMLASAAQQSSECVAAYAEAIADGRLTAAERDQVEREATEAIAALTSLRARVRAVPETGDCVRVLRAVRGAE